MKRKFSSLTKNSSQQVEELEESKTPNRKKTPKKLIKKEPDLKTVLQRLMSVFSAQGDGHIIGRSSEKQTIVSFLTGNIEQKKSGLLYICGHPGQGKTALLSQVLFEHFGYQDGSFGGTDKRCFVLKYNAMRFNSDNHAFAN